MIPAHNEEAVIARCLESLSEGAQPHEVEVIVVCNGCQDATAAVVRAGWPEVHLVELAEAGKTAALNEGDRHATAFPRFYVDADVQVSISSLRAVAAALAEEGVECAAPRPVFVVTGRPWIVRAFYQVWQQRPYLNDEVVGSGVYALSEAGRRRFGQLPSLTADDQFVMQLFTKSERRSVRSASFLVHTPFRLSGLVKMRQRVYRGNRELAASGLAQHEATGGRTGAWGTLGRRPQLIPATVAYLSVNSFAMLTARRGGRAGGWERDESARGEAAARPSPGSTVGYLVSRYPSISHTFVLREVLAAREAGLAVDTFSVRRAEPGDLLAEIDRREAASTWALRPITPAAFLRSQGRVLGRHPLAWTATLRFAVRQAPPGLRARIWQLLYFLQAVLLWEECDRRKITHLHAHLANVAADIAWLTSELGQRVDPAAGWGWSMSVHGPTEFFDVQRANLAAKVSSAKLVLCISDFARSQIMAVSPPDEWSKLAVVHMGADLQRYRAGAHPSPPPGAPTRILSVGRLDPVKGQTVLLDAISRLRHWGLAVHLTLVGDGPAAADLARAIDRLGLAALVDMPGAVGQDALPGFYADADIFCMASFAEGVPVVLMEAMACGLPVVSTRIAGIPELIEDGRSGLLVPPGRPDSLADALRRLVQDPLLRAQLGQSGRATVERDFNAELCGRQAAFQLARLVGVALQLRPEDQRRPEDQLRPED